MGEGQDSRRANLDARPKASAGTANAILSPDPLDQRWFVHIDNKTYGPYSGHEIKQFVADDRITAADLLCPEGGSAWVEAAHEPTLASLFRQPDAALRPRPSAAGARTHGTEEPSYASSDDPANVASLKRKWKRFGFRPSTLLQRADQESIREDLREFFGPRAEKYLAIYDKARAANKFHAISWNWAVFFATYTWFFYRKMFLFGACFIAIQFALSFLFGIYGMVAYAAALALGAKGQYVHWAMIKLDEADARGLVGKERQDYLGRAGGVSVAAGVLAGLLVATHYALAIYGTYLSVAGILP